MADAKPEWLKVRAPTGEGFGRIRELTRRCGLNTVCDSSHCPNISDCWSRGHATFMILGGVCTRNCAFCAVPSGTPDAVDPGEPDRVAEAVAALGLKHVVITSVTRDDLADHGAEHFAQVVRAVREANPSTTIELLIPDMMASPDALRTVAASRPDVIGHNVETVPRLQSLARDRRSSYERSMRVLRTLHDIDSDVLTKSSLMLGLGEREDEVLSTLEDLRSAGVQMVTMGQYLRPKGGRLAVSEYVHPEVFERYRRLAVDMGFRHVSSGPLVRSSFNAHEAFEKGDG
jgi:lipoic acid synthetase